MSQTEVIHCELLKLLQSSSVYLEQPEDQSENMSMSAVGQGGAPDETPPPETKLEALQQKITQLEAQVKVPSKLEEEHHKKRLFSILEKRVHKSSPNCSRIGRSH